MSIWSRLSTMVRSNLNDLIARAENPEKMLNQIIDDMRSQLAQAKQEVAVAIADERKLRRQVQDERDQPVRSPISSWPPPPVLGKDRVR